jgi:hypothetical protein
MVLFVAYGGGHVAMLAAVAQAMHAAGQAFTFLALTTARPYLERLGIPSIGFRDIPGANAARVQTWGERLAAELPAGGAVTREETVAYLGLSFCDLLDRHGEAGAVELYRTEGRQAFLPVAAMRALIGELRPTVLVASNSPRAERAAIIAAGELGVPAVCVVDMFALQEVAWIGQPGYAQRICVLNDPVRQMFLDRGRSDDEVVVTGNPAFDRLRTPATQQAGAALREARGWDDGLITVLWASQVEPARHPFTDTVGDPSLPCRTEQYLRNFVSENHGFRLVVRYHPSQQVVFVPQPAVELSGPDEDLATLLHAIDLVVVLTSTVGLEASLAGRPVISVDSSVFTEDAPYSRMGISTGVPTVEGLGEVLREFRRTAAGHAQGRPIFHEEMSATNNVVRVIESLL